MKMLLLILVGLVAHQADAQPRTCICAATSGGGDVNVRDCPSTDCNVVGLMSPGECADWLSTTGEWHEIMYNSAVAYIHGDYVSGPQECGGGTYCAESPLCSTYSQNEKRGCDAYGCGNYGASRDGGTRMHAGWDVRCDPAGATVYAPFEGTVTREAYPYGDGSCCDVGFEIQGSGSFSGHTVMIFYCDPDLVSIPATVAQGDPVATHASLHCGCYDTSMTDHIHYQLDYQGTTIDPASWLFDC